MRRKHTHTISSSSPVVFSFCVSSVIKTVASLDWLTAKLERSPIGAPTTGYGSMSDSAMVPDEAGIRSQIVDTCSLSNSSNRLLPLRTPVDWDRFLVKSESTDDWIWSSHAVTFSRCWSFGVVARRYASNERGVAKYGLCSWKCEIARNHNLSAHVYCGSGNTPA
jgi:hypothetical protein